MARAHGARAQMALAFETVYGTPPASGYRLMPFARTTLGAEQPPPPPPVVPVARIIQLPARPNESMTPSKSLLPSVLMSVGTPAVPVAARYD